MGALGWVGALPALAGDDADHIGGRRTAGGRIPGRAMMSDPAVAYAGPITHGASGPARRVACVGRVPGPCGGQISVPVFPGDVGSAQVFLRKFACERRRHVARRFAGPLAERQIGRDYGWGCADAVPSSNTCRIAARQT